jgi:hypothetical protein
MQQAVPRPFEHHFFFTFIEKRAHHVSRYVHDAMRNIKDDAVG